MVQQINDRSTALAERDTKKRTPAFQPDPSAGQIGALANAQPSAMGSNVGADPQATSSIGQLASPSTIGREQPTSDPAEMEQRIARNTSFLSDPQTKAQMLQFGLSMLSSAGRGNIGTNIGNALMSARGLPGRVAKLNLDYNKELQGMDIAERSQQVQEEQLGIQRAELGMKVMDQQQKLDMQAKRAAIFGAATGDMKSTSTVGAMSDVGLLETAGKLAASGDLEGAKLAVDIAKARGMGDTTTELTNYKAGLADGSIPKNMGFYTYLREQNASKKAVTNINTAPKEVYTIMAKASDMADTANQKIPELQQMLELAKKTPTGWTTPYTLPVRAALLSMGITVDATNETVPLQQLMQANSAKLALNLRSPTGAFSEGGLTGSTSDRDLQFLLSAVAGLGNTPEANQAMLIGNIAKARREAEISSAKADYIAENDSLKGWSAEAKKIFDKPMLTEEEKTYIDSLTNPERVRPDVINSGGPNVPGSPNIKGTEDVPALAPDYLTQEHKDLWDHADPELRKFYITHDKPAKGN